MSEKKEPAQSPACKQLNEFTIQKGAPFPFDAVDVDDLAKPVEKERTIAVKGKQFRVDGDDATPNALRQIARDYGLTEFKQEKGDATTA